MSAEESRGRIIAQSDKNILAAQRLLASEGVWVEPASAAGLAGLKAEIEAGDFDPKGQKITIVCTGHGMKDPGIIADSMPTPKVIPAKMGALRDLLGI